MGELFNIKGRKKKYNLTNKKNSSRSILYVLSEYIYGSDFMKDILGNDFLNSEIMTQYFTKLESIETFRQKKEYEKYDEEAAKIILDLIRELLLKVNFTDGLAFDLLKAWKDYEEVIFDIKDFYREHFIHQYHDFLFGCLFLEKIWKEFSVYFDKRRFLRRWLFASMFHDIGYPAESLDDMQENLHKRFFNKIPIYGIKEIKLDSYEPIDENLPRLIRNIALIHLFSENISINDVPYEKYDKFVYPLEEIYNLLIDELRQTHDHGVTGAIFFLKTALIDLREVVIDPNNSNKTTIFTAYEPYSHLLDDIFISAAAISGHNLRVRTYPSYTVDFSSRPIAALLNFCDDFQEWDRRKKHSDQKSKWTNGVVKIRGVYDEGDTLNIEFSTSTRSKSFDIQKIASKIYSTMESLFDTNLSDLNLTFYKDIVVTVDKKIEPLIIKLNTKEDDKRAYSHRIGRYKITNPLK